MNGRAGSQEVDEIPLVGLSNTFKKQRVLLLCREFPSSVSIEKKVSSQFRQGFEAKAR